MAEQGPRTLTLATALKDADFVIDRFFYTERLGGLFEAQVEVTSANPSLPIQDTLGKGACVALLIPTRGELRVRRFHGVVWRVTQSRTIPQGGSYILSVVPWTWLLTRASDCRIFQKMSVPDIVQQVFRDRGFSDAFRVALKEKYEPVEFCVQYRETDFNFVSRLLEQAGIYYFFEHDEEKHTLVLADQAASHAQGDFPDGEYKHITYRPPSEGTSDPERVREWSLAKEFLSDAYAHTDYNFLTPRSSLDASSPCAHGLKSFGVFDYPGEYTDSGGGQALAKVRAQEVGAGFEVLRGRTDIRGITAGRRYTLQDHPREDQNREYLVTAATIEAGNDAPRSAGGGEEATTFECAFECIPFSVQFRPARLTPRPVIQGCQTAVVVGPSGEEIHTDEHGRVKVQFHWDRHGKMDENSSCWIRVAQSWAGKKYGAIFTPRIGQEVIVEFEEGDPDRPLITGRVYNAANMPPYGLPGFKTISTIKSNSSKGGAGFNEIRFEDKKGEEQVFVHAEKNVDVRVKNDTFEWVGHDRHLIVKNDRVEKVEHDRHETVDHDHKEKIGNDRNLEVAGKEAKKVAGTLSLKVAGDVAEVFGANHSEKVASDFYLKAKNICLEADTNITIKVGGTAIAIEKTSILITSDKEIEIKSKLDLKTKAVKLEMKSDATAKIEAGASAELKSAKTDVKGDAMLTVKGGIVMIN